MTKKGSLPGFMSVDHVSITVPDLDAAVRFYCDVFGAEVGYRMGPFDATDMPVQDDGRDWTEAHVDVKGAKLSIAMLKLADNLMIELFQYDKPDYARQDPPRNCDIGGHHLAFRVSDLDAAISHLAEKGCAPLEGPIVMDEGPTVGCRAQYLKDPWGNYFELMEYKNQAYMDETGVRPYGT